MYKKFIKRFLDFVIAIIAVIVLSPILITVALILTFINTNTGIFFLQYRPGKNEKLFQLIKFKTMTDEKGANGNLLPAKDRLTRFGLFLRKTSVDELPQLFNVIMGDISLIGPRPLLTEYIELYTKEQRNRHSVKPGISGWAQVNGRNAVTWKQKMEYDLWYVNNLSFLLDCKIFFLTIKRIFIRDGVLIELTRPTKDDFK